MTTINKIKTYLILIVMHTLKIVIILIMKVISIIITTIFLKLLIIIIKIIMKNNLKKYNSKFLRDKFSRKIIIMSKLVI